MVTGTARPLGVSGSRSGHRLPAQAQAQRVQHAQHAQQLGGRGVAPLQEQVNIINLPLPDFEAGAAAKGEPGWTGQCWTG